MQRGNRDNGRARPRRVSYLARLGYIRTPGKLAVHVAIFGFFAWAWRSRVQRRNGHDSIALLGARRFIAHAPWVPPILTRDRAVPGLIGRARVPGRAIVGRFRCHGDGYIAGLFSRRLIAYAPRIPRISAVYSAGAALLGWACLAAVESGNRNLGFSLLVPLACDTSAPVDSIGVNSGWSFHQPTVFLRVQKQN